MQRQTDARQIKTQSVIPVATFKLEPMLFCCCCLFLFDHAILIGLSELVAHQFNKNKAPHPPPQSHFFLFFFFFKSYGVCIVTINVSLYAEG